MYWRNASSVSGLHPPTHSKATVRRKPVPPKTKECVICTEAKVESEYPKSGHFQHHQSCASCIKRYIEAKIVDGGSTDIRCLDTSCKASLGYDEVRKYCSKNVFARYDDFVNKKTHETSKSFRHCSNPKCGVGHYIDNGDSISFFTCPACNTKTCFNCSVEFHTGYTCAQYQEGLKLQKTSAAVSEGWLKANAKLCGSCGKWIQKAEGCDHMTCICGAEWCYVCGAAYGSIRLNGNRAHTRGCNYWAP